MRVTVVANPRAGAGNAARRLSALRQGLERNGIEHEVLETREPGHASELARTTRARGTDVLAVLGGDGTLNEVAQAYIDGEGMPLPGPPIALVPAGTGGDFARTCGMTDSSIQDIIARLMAPSLQPLDLGVISLAGGGGGVVHRAFVNVASVGISGEVDERVERGPKWLGGKAAFMLATVGAALSYRNVPMEIEVDGEVWHRGPVLMTAIANARYLGGGMHIAPNADFADGLFDIVCVGDLTRARFLSLFPKVYAGTHLELDMVRSTRGKKVDVRPLRASKPVLVDVDGETPGYLPLTARMFPSALRLVGP
jgi:YegS/Rv2252/BmrU family lipid kinase